MAKKKKSSRSAVGTPLTPNVLSELGAFRELPQTPGDFSPQGNWVNTYRIWTCHGYRESGNEDVGFLRLERTRGMTAASFTLTVDQTIVNNEAVVHRIHAQVRCRGNELASPSQWELSSRFIGPDANPLTKLCTEETVRVGDDHLVVTVNGRSFRRDGSTRLTSDWCLFEAVQRLPFAESAELNCDVLEGLSLLKKGQRVSFHGPYSLQSQRQQLALQEFRQVGPGILPYGYWLDERHRLVAVVTHSRAYLLDDEAPRKIDRVISGSRQYFQKSRERNKGS